jgi:glutathione S-transferase
MLRLVGGASFRTFRNLWMLEELGVAYEHVPASPLSPDARAHNPFGKVPALHDPEHDFTMYESAAINTYLGDKFSAFSAAGATAGAGVARPRLVPSAGTPARGRYEQTVFCIMTELDAQGLWIHRKHETFGRVFGHCPEAVAHAKATSLRTVGVLAKQLRRGGGPFLLGADFTAADVLFVHSLNWAENIGWGDKWLAAAAPLLPDESASEMQTFINATRAKVDSGRGAEELDTAALRAAQEADKASQWHKKNAAKAHEANAEAVGGSEDVDPDMASLAEYSSLCRARPAYLRTVAIKEREEKAERERKAASKKRKQAEAARPQDGETTPRM